MQGLSQEARDRYMTTTPPTHLDGGELIVYHGSSHYHGCRSLLAHEDRWQITLFYSLPTNLVEASDAVVEERGGRVLGNCPFPAEEEDADKTENNDE